MALAEDRIVWGCLLQGAFRCFRMWVWFWPMDNGVFVQEHGEQGWGAGSVGQLTALEAWGPVLGRLGLTGERPGLAARSWNTRAVGLIMKKHIEHISY